MCTSRQALCERAPLQIRFDKYLIARSARYARVKETVFTEYALASVCRQTTSHTLCCLQYGIQTNRSRPDMVLSASADESVRLWNVVTGLLVGVFSGDQGHTSEVLRVSWSAYRPDLFVSCGVDASVRIWSIHQVCNSSQQPARIQPCALYQLLEHCRDHTLTRVLQHRR